MENLWLCYSDQSAIKQERNNMDAVKILEKPTTLNWDYDEETDILYLSIGEPRSAVGVLNTTNNLAERYLPCL